MELVVTLPVNHPLGPISVECGRRVGVANTQWRNWMLQMVTFLSHQVSLGGFLNFIGGCNSQSQFSEKDVRHSHFRKLPNLMISISCFNDFNK